MTANMDHANAHNGTLLVLAQLLGLTCGWDDAFAFRVCRHQLHQL